MITIPDAALNADIELPAKIMAGVLNDRVAKGQSFTAEDATGWFNDHITESIKLLANGDFDKVDKYTIEYLCQSFGL